MLLYSGAGTDFCSIAHAPRVSASLASVSLAREPWERGRILKQNNNTPVRVDNAVRPAHPLRTWLMQSMNIPAVGPGEEGRGRLRQMTRALRACNARAQCARAVEARGKSPRPVPHHSYRAGCGGKQLQCEQHLEMHDAKRGRAARG